MSRAEALVTPEAYIEYLRGNGIPAAALHVPETLFAAWGPLSRALSRRLGARRRHAWPYDEDWPFREARRVGVVRLPTGAPAAAFLLDQMVACGARRILVVGIAGSLTPDLRPGATLVADAALAGDGTSVLYGARAGRPVPASRALGAKVLTCLRGAGVTPERCLCWTNDAPFCETPKAAEEARSAGATAVDMEMAAIYALARRRAVEACGILVASDRVLDKWEPAFGSPEVSRALALLARALPALATT